MKHESFNLPELFTEKKAEPAFHIQFYSAQKASLKNKVNLSQNLLCLVQKGRKEIFSPLAQAQADERQLLLLPSGSVLMSESTTVNHEFNSILLFFSDNFLTDFCLKYNLEPGANTSANPGIVVLDKDHFIVNFQSSLSLIGDLKNEAIQQLKIEEILLYLLHSRPAEIRAFIKNALSQSYQLKIRQTVLNNLDNNLSLDELAFLCNMSLSTFKRHFTEIFQAPPKKYMTGYKMQKAKKLLKLNKRASDVYSELGYENLSAFSSEFKKHFGVSPKNI